MGMDKRSSSHDPYDLTKKGRAFAALENLQALSKGKKKLSDPDKYKKREDDFTQTDVESASVTCIIIVQLHKEN